jgi:pimeloyl-ACP methyl ester carboxylesterase
VVYEAEQLLSDKVVCIDETNPYFRMLHNTWGQKLREVFDSIEDPVWDGGATEVPLMVVQQLADFVRAGIKAGAPAPFLVGHSLGGFLSLMCAARHPELARGVLLIDSPVLGGWRPPHWG